MVTAYNAIPPTYVYVTGKVKWFRQNVPDSKFEPARWGHVMYPNDESLEKIRKLQSEGILNKLKLDDDGYCVNLARPCYREYTERSTGMKRKLQFDPPEVIDKEGQPCQAVNVGNGSTVTTKLEVRSYPKPGGGNGKSIRWASSRIDDLVEYNPSADNTPRQAQAVKGLADQPNPEEEMF